MDPVISALVLASSLLFAQPQAPAPAPADQPAPRPDPMSRLAHEQLVAKAKKGGIDLYFCGDSITRRWGTSDPQHAELLANWKQNFFGWNAGDFGWGADFTQHILWRLENGELDGVNPKVIVLMAGTNNIGGPPPASADDVARGVKAILDVMRRKVPDATVILMGVTPRNDHGLDMIPVINAANEKLARLADGKRVRYLNINDKLADKDGKLFEGMTVDKLHLSAKGYQVWADALKPILTELLGPRADTDHAPPPTGVPRF